MDKYHSLSMAIYDIFASAKWVGYSIDTFPSNFVTPDGLTKYIRVHVIPNGSNTVSFPKSASGVIIIDIFTKYGKGTEDTFGIADLLDTVLAGKSIKITGGNLQTSVSSLTLPVKDSDTPSLAKAKYTVSFNYYGE